MRVVQAVMNAVRRPSRGFVLVVVVMALAIASAVVVGQLSSARSEAVSAVRVEEEVQARAIAEGCLGLLQGYVNGYMSPTTPTFDDFDLLLDRDSTTNTADDYQPNISGAVTVQVPKGTADRLHAWQFLRRGPAGRQGACYLRLEDNSDDGIANNSVQLGATGPNEGPAPPNDGKDNQLRDRDRAINLTVIGVFPALAATANADVWDRAHARVTIKRLHAVRNTPQFQPAISACGDISFGNAAQFCGSGGLAAGDDITLSNSCACGSLQGDTFTPATPPTQCGCCTAPGTSASSGSPVPCTPPPTPPQHHYLGISGFGDPNNPGAINLGNTAQCKVFVQNNSIVRPQTAFMWDVSDNQPFTTLQAAPFNIPPANFTGGAGANDNCTSYNGAANYSGIGAEAEVERPCTWDFSGAGHPIITCAANQTLCWKPIAVLDNVDNDANFTAGGAAQFEWESDNNDADLMFYKSQPIPYVKDTTKRLAAGANTLCGATAGVCDNCEAGAKNRSSSNWLMECDNASAPCNDFHAHSQSSNTNFPAPTIFIVEADSFDRLELEQPGGDTEPIWATWLLNKSPDIQTASGFCSAMMPNGCVGPMTGRLIAAANCVTAGAQVPPPLYPGTPRPPQQAYPVVFRVNNGTNTGQCSFDEDNTYVGSIECPAISMSDTPCLVGDLIATNQFTVGSVSACNTAECNPAGAPDIGVCFNDNFNSAGAVVWSLGSVCGGGTNNATFNMDINTLGNVDFKNQITVNGVINAGGDVSFKNTAQINYNAVTFITSGTQGLTSFMECSW
ncbi:MAG: hypothetical protein HYS27_19960 [Deltaproteobacteria bacterium]|nr:hypothetical protein [Deltaproteobacteria bacterium]